MRQINSVAIEQNFQQRNTFSYIVENQPSIMIQYRLKIIQSKQINKQSSFNRPIQSFRQKKLEDDPSQLTHISGLYQMEEINRQSEQIMEEIQSKCLNSKTMKTLAFMSTKQQIPKIKPDNEQDNYKFDSNLVKSKQFLIKEQQQKDFSMSVRILSQKQVIRDEKICCSRMLQQHQLYQSKGMFLQVCQQFQNKQDLMKLLINIVAFLNSIGGIILIGCRKQKMGQYIEPIGYQYSDEEKKIIQQAIYRLILLLISPKPKIGKHIKVQFIPAINSSSLNDKQQKLEENYKKNKILKQQNKVDLHKLYIIRIIVTPCFLIWPKKSFNKVRQCYFNLCNKLETGLVDDLNKRVQQLIRETLSFHHSQPIKIKQLNKELSRHTCPYKDKDQQTEKLTLKINQEIQGQEFQKYYKQIQSNYYDHE